MNIKDEYLNQHSSLTTFKLKEGKYFTVNVEKVIFMLLLKAQQNLRKNFKNILLEEINKLIPNEYHQEVLESAYKGKEIDIPYNMKKLEEIVKKIKNYEEEELKKEIKDPDSYERMLRYQKQKGLYQITFKDNNKLSEKEILNEVLKEIKNYSKSRAIKENIDFTTIDYTLLAGSINSKQQINAFLLRKELRKAVETVLEFNYIDRKNLDVEVVSVLLSSVRFTSSKNRTWMTYQIPREILELLLIPEVYVPLEGLVIQGLTGSYTIRMYGLLKDHLKRGEVELTREELFNFFMLPKSYENKTNMVKYFLVPTLKELEEVSGIHTDYEFYPTKNYTRIKFYPRTVKKVKTSEIKIITKEQREITITSNEKVQKYIDKAKKNIYVAKAWNKRVDNKIEKLLQEQGEEYTVEILKTLYNSLKEDIQYTLVQYINGIIKNSPVKKTISKKKSIQQEKQGKEPEQNPSLKNDPMTEIMYNMFLMFDEEKQNEIKKEALRIYLEETNLKMLDKTFEKIYKLGEKIYIIKVLKEMMGNG